ncbi:MAG: carboxypeptidase regulatory-like domain-containing protein [Pyrinomonadaceae bacterium]
MFRRFLALTFAFLMIFASLVNEVPAQRPAALLRGHVSDQNGALVVGATVSLRDASGAEKTVTTNREGLYVFSGIAPGKYTLSAKAPGFAPYERTDFEVSTKNRDPFNITLSVTLKNEEVTIADRPALSTAPENNASGIAISGNDLNALPDDRGDLVSALQALAGPSAGPSGGEIFIDGFSGGIMPPKSSIREIRINQNPFSAQFDRQGFGRIEIFTKPGADKFGGEGTFAFSDESLNSRNPFLPNRAPYQSRRFEGNITGPIIEKRASFFLGVERDNISDNAIITATILDPALAIIPLNMSVVRSQKATEIDMRFDVQLDRNNTLVARLEIEPSVASNSGVGRFSLLSRAYDTTDNNHELRLTETAVLSAKVINEVRLQYVRTHSEQRGDNSVPTLDVQDAFTGGGSQVGLATNQGQRFDLQDYVIGSFGQHLLRYGGRLRRTQLTSISPQNFGGTYTFTGGSAPQLLNDEIVFSNGVPVLETITSIQRYQRTLQLQRHGFSPAAIRERGGGATQFSIAGGNPRAEVKQLDFSFFVQDDWRLRQNFMLAIGMRYERQSNISSNLNLAPRISIAWSPGTKRGGKAKTVLRAGFGVFYERFNQSFTLQANRFNGLNQQQFIVSDPLILNLFPNVPSIATLTAFAQPQTVRLVADDLQAPYTLQSALSFERQLPFNLTLGVSYLNSRSLHVLRSRNINAPLPGTFIPNVSGSGIRPLANTGNVFEFESSGIFEQNQIVVSINKRLGNNLTLFANYALNKAQSDTDGAASFPANTYDLSGEYGRAALDIRHRFNFGGSISGPWGLRFNPLIIAASGPPFNLVTGFDTNGDTLFTERPAFATSLTKPDRLVQTPFGTFDLDPAPGQQVIPRNFGNGPSSFALNLAIRKSFSFDFRRGSLSPKTSQNGRGSGAEDSEKRYQLTFALEAQNILNHTNLGTPVGNLSSPFFGRSLSLAGGNAAAGNRRIEAQIGFSF